MNIQLNTYEYLLLIVGSFRYALGRQTYVVEETISFLKKNWNELDVAIKDIIIRDLNREIELHQSCMKSKGYQSLDDGWVTTNLGGKYDIISWLNFQEWINTNDKK